MEFELLNRDSLKEYMRVCRWLDWNNVLYSEDVLNPDCMAFGIRDNGRPKALIITELESECAEIKMHYYSSHHAFEILMGIFSDYCHSMGINKLTYELKMTEDDEKIFKKVIIDNGWNEPKVRYKLYELKIDNVPFLQNAKRNKLQGVVIPFFETSMEQRCKLAHRLPEDSVYYQIENPEAELCVAYVEDNEIKGFILAENTEGRFYLKMDKMSTEPLAIVNMMCEVSDRLEKKNIHRVFVSVKEKYGEQFIKKVFSNQIIGSEITIYSEG